MKKLITLLCITTALFSCTKENGCTDPRANNFNPEAEIDNGTCAYDDLIRGCTNPLSDNFNPEATIDDGTCLISGCTDPQSENYNPQANVNDGSCIDKREKYAGDWSVDHDCGFLPVGEDQTIYYNDDNSDSIFVENAFLGSTLYGLVNGSFITLPTQGQQGLATFDGSGTFNSDSTITINVNYDLGFLGTGTCTLNYQRP